MAYAVLLSLAQTINQILDDDDQFPISDNDKLQITSLREHVIFLLEFLQKFPKEASSLEVRIRNAANEAEDNLEGFMYESILKIYSQIRSSTSSQLNDFDELKEVVEKINSIFREAAKTVALCDTPSVPRSSSTLAPAAAGGVVTVGLDDDLLKIKDLLSGESSNLQIIQIIGMGGIGKTTLARKAYHDQLIIENFPIRAWVTVSQDYKASNIFSDILDFLKKVGDERSGERSDIMLEKVYKSLTGRKYLIVLDDIWSTKAWNDVKFAFPDDENGSRIVLTTRIEDVASYAESSDYLHRMQFMKAGICSSKRCFPTKIGHLTWKTLAKILQQAVEDCPLQLY